MSAKYNKPQSDMELARLLAQGAVDLHSLKTDGYKEDGADFPKLTVRTGLNVFSFSHSRGKRFLLALGYATKPTDVKIFEDRIEYTLARQAPYIFQVNNGCVFFILNPTRNILLSLAVFILAIKLAPYLPVGIYSHIESFLQLILG